MSRRQGLSGQAVGAASAWTLAVVAGHQHLRSHAQTAVRCACNLRMLLLLLQALGMLLLLLPAPLVAQSYMNIDTVHVMTNLLTRSLTGASTYTCTHCLSVTPTHLPERTPLPQTCVGSVAASAPAPRQNSPPCVDCWASWASPAATPCPNPGPGSCGGRALQYQRAPVHKWSVRGLCVGWHLAASTVSTCLMLPSTLRLIATDHPPRVCRAVCGPCWRPL